MIVHYLNSKTPYGGVTIKELAQKFDVSERQIYRDINTIENILHVPLVKKDKTINNAKVTHYCLRTGYLPSLSPEKATILFLSLLRQSDSIFSGYLNELKDVLVSTLFKYHYDPQELAVEKLQKRIHLVKEAVVDPERVGRLFSKLVEAVKNSHRVKLWYFVAYKKQVTKRVVEPYGLICKRNNWYLVAWCLKRKDIRVFRVDQINDVIAYETEKFSYPTDFDIENYMADSWGVFKDDQICEVRIKVSSQVAFRFKNQIYHPSQKIIAQQSDGSLIISYKVCGIKEMKTWIVQWGSNAEVLEPQWLRKEMCTLTEKMFKVYCT